MKKAFFVLISAFLFVSCEFWNEPVEEFFSYWSAQAYVTDSTVNASKQSDSSGVTSIASDKECVVLLKTENPKDFRLIMPSSENTDMIRFNGLDVQPRLDIDYTFELLDTDTLKLTYKKDFLQAHEWGEKDLGASIILYAEDGRKFNKPYSFNIKSNTPPPPLNVVLAKTTASPEQYVLCLYVSPSEMSKKIGEELLHKDIAEIEINDTSYALTVNGTKNDFVKPAEESFIASGNVTKLMEANAKDLPTGSWILYYKTGRNIGSGSFLYTIKLKDEKGLTSTLETATTLNMPADETVDITQGSQDSESGSGTEESPFIIKPGTGTQEARIKISCATDNTTVYCTVTDTVTASTSQHSGAKSVTVLLALNSADEKLYKVEYQTKGDGFSPTTLKTKYYKILKLHTVTFDANGGKFPADLPTAAQHVLHGRKVSAPSTQPAKDGYVFAGWYKEQEGTNKWEFVSENVTGNMTLYAKWTNNALIINSSDSAGEWKKLKEEAAKPSGVSVIVIKGEIKATSGDDSGQIEVNRNLTIQGNAGDGTDKLNAAGLSRIFRLESGIKLTLENLTLTGGKTTGSALEGSGGAIYSVGEVILENCKIENCYATGDGGAIYSEGALTLNGCTIGGEQCYNGSESGKTKGNTASIGGGIYATAKTGEKKVSVTETTISNNTAIHQGGGINFISDNGRLITADLDSVTVTNNKLTDTNSQYSNGGGIYTKGGTLNMKSCTVTGNNAVLGGGGIYAVKNGSTPAAVKIKGGTIEENTVSGNASKGHGGGIHISENCTLTMKGNVKINGNTAQYDGGGIYAYDSTVVMENCTVTGNKARSGGGIYTKGGGTFNMTGCTIGGSGMEEGNTAGDSGGGVYSGQSTTATMKDCSVMGNKAKSGGGIYAEGTTDSAKSTVTITGGTIGGSTAGAGNKATGTINSSGGGIYVVQYADVTLNGTANVIGNTADGKGGGVYVKNNYTTFTMSGGAKVDTATADNDVYLESGAKITVNGALSNAQAACITPQTYAAATQVLNGNIASGTPQNFTKFAVTQTNGNVWRVGSDGKLKLNTVTVSGETSEKWKNLKKAVNDVEAGGTIIIDGEVKATNDNGNNGEITISKNLTVKKADSATSAVLDANGQAHRILKITETAQVSLENLTLQNGNAAGTGEASKGGAIYTKDGTVTMQNCILTGNTTKFDNVTSTYIGYGGGVYHMGGILKIYGGEIKGNSANDGGGVYAEKANVTITGCTFTGNESSEHGGGIQVTDGTATMEHCTFTGNKSSSGGDGGGMRITGGTVEITSCTFTGNSAFSGGAIDVLGTNDISASVTISGGIIGGTGTDAKNSANSTYDDRGGGGIHVSGKADVTIQNYTDGDTEQGVMIIGNTAGTFGGQGGGVYLAENSTFKMYGGSITGNTGSGKGDGVYVASASTSDSQDANFIMGGAACVGEWDNAGILQDGNDVYLGKNTYSGHLVSIKIDKHKPITLSKAACITPQLYDDSQAVLRMSDGSAVGNYNDKFTVTPQDLGGGDTQHWEVDSDGKLMRVVDAVKYPNNAWKALKAAVNAAQPGGTITVKGEVKATDATGNNGEITIDKNLTIKKADSATSAVLDANGQAHRILKITGNAQVSLENLTLQNGKETTSPDTGGSGGGGIFMEGTAHLQLTGVTIQTCTSKAPGGGLRMDYDAAGGGTLFMKDCKIINNTVIDDSGIAESSGGGIDLPNCPYTAVIDTCEISGNKVDVSTKKGSGPLTITACGLYTGNKPNSITEIKGHTVIDGNSYVKHDARTTKVSGIGIWMQGGVVNIGENGKPDSESPVIRNHKVGNADEVHGTAIYLEGSAKVNWLSGHITGNGGPAAKAVYVRTGYGTPVFNNESGNTAN